MKYKKQLGILVCCLTLLSLKSIMAQEKVISLELPGQTISNLLYVQFYRFFNIPGTKQLNPWRKADEKGGFPQKYSSDGVHPNLEGYKIIMEEIVGNAIVKMKLRDKLL
jgi:hypothetical protein